MTVDELWKNLKPIVNNLEDKVDNLECKVDNLEPLMGKVEKLEPLVGKVDTIEKKVENLEPLVGEVHDIKASLHQIKDVNMTSMIKLQMETMQEIKKANQKLDQYLDKNEVEHKKFEYEIAKLGWQNRIAN